MTTTKRHLVVLAMAAATVLSVGAAMVPASAATAPTSRATSVSPTASYCGIQWGSLPKETGATNSTDALANVRAGQHSCYDRLVIDGATWATVSYVDQVRQDGSGTVVPLRGGARLQIITSRADDVNTGEPTYIPADPNELVGVKDWPTFRQVAFAGSFEGQSTVGLGVRAQLPFRVFVLTDNGQAPRVVVDVAHHW